jgi:hypothetical protein
MTRIRFTLAIELRHNQKGQIVDDAGCHEGRPDVYDSPGGKNQVMFDRDLVGLT